MDPDVEQMFHVISFKCKTGYATAAQQYARTAWGQHAKTASSLTPSKVDTEDKIGEYSNITLTPVPDVSMHPDISDNGDNGPTVSNRSKLLVDSKLMKLLM